MSVLRDAGAASDLTMNSGGYGSGVRRDDEKLFEISRRSIRL
jgi:hypothetical protein